MTFRTLLRVLRGQKPPKWAAVAWVQGRNAAPLESLPNLPFSVQPAWITSQTSTQRLASAAVNAAAACATSQRVGIPAGPAAQLWALLAEQPARRDREVRESDARRLVAWLPEAVCEPAYTLL